MTTKKTATKAKQPTSSAASDRKNADTKKSPAKPSATATKPTPVRSEAEIAEIRAALDERLQELRDEYQEAIVGISEMQKERLSDSAGDDQVDSGSKTVEREQEISLANSVRDRMIQVERALERLDDGDYGICERCGTAIPAARLAAFPSATLCVNCKQLEERR
ncbi:TraR/DksA family transcriptional regulator [Stackebrandtia endophytica]|uniref:TraR/DksA family transcriptional regulator n=1 Tax=Stackebrandtia endophytica TaxID=1496996 RepID=A0A543B3A8_9ACTN|nr:TraR/DksA family transcriptional regulator [Stackebrandtia endophytica]TQL79293.1 TraR/DksA family transcriptional regulator [Stackebrandtia endophytica]